MELDADFAWIIDPVDGTNNYALRFPLCAISLGLLYRGEPVYGFIYDRQPENYSKVAPDIRSFTRTKETGKPTRLAAENKRLLAATFL